MSRKRVYSGTYYSNKSSTIPANTRRKTYLFFKSLKENFELVCELVMDYYLLCGTIFFILVMSFVLPDFMQKISTNKEIISLKNIVNLMSKEVSRAEVACLTAADRLCYLQCTMQDGATETPKRQYEDLSVCTSFLQTRTEPVQVEKKIGLLRRIFFPKRASSQQEVTLMSYVYTNSFDAHKPNNGSLKYDCATAN